MNKPVSYILSFITSVLLVLSLLGSLIALVAMNFASPDKLYDITREKNLSHTVWTELEKYYSKRYNTTGIPADVYMNAISENYLDDVIRTQIDNGFYVLTDWEQADSVVNTALETALSDFYSDYADSIGAPKDAKYDEKLSEAKENANEIIADYCDVFKLRAMENHGILKKIAPFYSKLPTAVLIICGAMVFLALLLVLINIKSSSTAFWWIGISALVSGIAGAVPCFYLKATDYFSAFTIKQAQVYSAYTSAMTAFVNNFMTFALISAVVGIVFVIIYIFLVKNKKYIKTA
ncbi:MAG: hypothetical protein NC340_07380 [Ruminococcus flavefaciens]|nr:hypothetical protein [Ruminococcus flavefaciens]MCM1231615.1 hypothetical protein [Ruminococcus flavefaciens]